MTSSPKMMTSVSGMMRRSRALAAVVYSYSPVHSME